MLHWALYEECFAPPGWFSRTQRETQKEVRGVSGVPGTQILVVDDGAATNRKTALRKASGNQTKAAELLGMQCTHLVKLLRALRIREQEAAHA